MRTAKQTLRRSMMLDIRVSAQFAIITEGHWTKVKGFCRDSAGCDRLRHNGCQALAVGLRKGRRIRRRSIRHGVTLSAGALSAAVPETPVLASGFTIASTATSAPGETCIRTYNPAVRSA